MDLPLAMINNPQAIETYDHLLERLSTIGQFEERPNKTSIHLVRGSTFLGVHPRKGGILLVLRTKCQLKDARIRKHEQVSANRWHNEVMLEAKSEIDDQLLNWIREAYFIGHPGPSKSSS